jgi:hypothetical protein
MFFNKKNPPDEENPSEEELAEAVVENTKETEAEKAEKRRARLERKFLKEHAEKSARRARLVAPLLLILTGVVTYIVWVLSQ